MYIDEPVLHGILAGVVALLAAAWLLFLRNAVWRAYLRERVGDGLAGLGLSATEAGWRPALEVSGPPGVRLTITARFGRPRLVVVDRRAERHDRHRRDLGAGWQAGLQDLLE